MEALTKHQKRKERERKRYHTYLRLENTVFQWVLILLCVVGLLIPLRPKKSNVEKRDLEKFPEISVSGVLKGDFFTDISTWYADTFPFRERLLTANAAVERL